MLDRRQTETKQADLQHSYVRASANHGSRPSRGIEGRWTSCTSISMPQTKLLLRLRLRLDLQVRIQVQSLASGDVNFLIKLRASRCAQFYVVTARPQMHGFQLPHCARVSAIDIHLCVFDAGVELQCACRRSVTVISVRNTVPSKGRILPTRMLAPQRRDLRGPQEAPSSRRPLCIPSMPSS